MQHPEPRRDQKDQALQNELATANLQALLEAELSDRLLVSPQSDTVPWPVTTVQPVPHRQRRRRA